LSLHYRCKLSLELVDVISDPQGVIAELIADLGEVLMIVGFINFPREVA